MLRNVSGSAGVQSSPEHILLTLTLSLSLLTFSGQNQLSFLLCQILAGPQDFIFSLDSSLWLSFSDILVLMVILQSG